MRRNREADRAVTSHLPRPACAGPESAFVPAVAAVATAGSDSTAAGAGSVRMGCRMDDRPEPRQNHRQERHIFRADSPYFPAARDAAINRPEVDAVSAAVAAARRTDDWQPTGTG